VKLPRAYPAPPPKEETRWEKFAKEKGIKKTKREKVVWDEQHGEWRRSWGYKRANAGVEAEPLVEVGHGQDPYADPWTEARREKRQRVVKNEIQRVKNLKSGLPLDMMGQQRGKQGTREALHRVQFATASLGKFDEELRGEPKKKKQRVKKVGGREGSSDLEVLQRVLRGEASRESGRAKGGVEQYDGLIPDGIDRGKRKKGRSAFHDGDDKKGRKGKKGKKGKGKR
jgi:regulator of ribosome biosynthesis